MSRKFTLLPDPYDCNVQMFKKKYILIEQGITVLVGCNGIGKSTMLNCLEEQLRKEGIPCIHFDNLKEGGSNATSEACFFGDFPFISSASISSEGENIMLNIGKIAERIGVLVRTGEDNTKSNRLTKLFTERTGENSDTKELSNERWILLDAIDSGFSVDNVIELKELLFKTILKHNFGKEIYIVISANEYELANGEQCFDVYNGNYVTFKNYDEYREMILQSRKEKDKRKNSQTNFGR